MLSISWYTLTTRRNQLIKTTLSGINGFRRTEIHSSKKECAVGYTEFPSPETELVPPLRSYAFFPSCSLSSRFPFEGFLCVISTSPCLLGLSALLRALCLLFQILKRENVIGCWPASGLAGLWSGVHHRSNQGRGGEGTRCKYGRLDPAPPSTEAVGGGKQFQKGGYGNSEHPKTYLLWIRLYNCADRLFLAKSPEIKTKFVGPSTSMRLQTASLAWAFCCTSQYRLDECRFKAMMCFRWVGLWVLITIGGFHFSTFFSLK